MDPETREYLEAIDNRIQVISLRIDGLRHDFNALISRPPNRKEPSVAAYRKFIVALVGFAVVIAHNQGVDIAEDVSNAVITLLTALGVFVVPNE